MDWSSEILKMNPHERRFYFNREKKETSWVEFIDLSYNDNEKVPEDANKKQMHTKLECEACHCLGFF